MQRHFKINKKKCFGENSHEDRSGAETLFSAITKRTPLREKSDEEVMMRVDHRVDKGRRK